MAEGQREESIKASSRISIHVVPVIRGIPADRLVRLANTAKRSPLLKA